MKRDDLSATVHAAEPHDGNMMTTSLAQQSKHILEERALALAQSAEQEQEPQATVRTVEFLLAQQHYAVETSYVREVQHVASITPIPCTPLFVLGVINVRGRILSVIDLPVFFDLPQSRATESGVVVVLGTEDLEVGVLVDELVGTRMVAEEEIRSTPAGHSSIRREYLRGAVKEQLLVLDVERLLSDERLLVGADETEI